ncbi:MAG: site-2 protease family protein [Candidatus Micrarchaeota archaeon]
MQNAEIYDIVVSMLAVAVAFSVPVLLSEPSAIPVVIPIILVTVGLGFLLHELAHKYVAQRYGAYAVYRAWPQGLGLMLLLAFITGGRFFIAAPGAVYIFAPYIRRRENGIISLAGPLTNLALAVVFGFVFMMSGGGLGATSPDILQVVQAISLIGARVNLFLGLFNMLPIFPLDGSKVLAWNGGVWFGYIIAVILVSFAFGVPI